MIVIKKDEEKRLRIALRNRYEALTFHLNTGPLKKTDRWKDPDTLCRFLSSKTEVNLAIADFSAILSELKKLKDNG
jgi:hypothetical protein